MGLIWLKRGVVLSMLLLAAGCVTVPKKQAFNKAQASGIKTITVAVLGDESKYDLQMLAHPGIIFVGGAIGAEIARDDMQKKAVQFVQTINPSKTRLRQTFASELERRLAQDGYQIRRFILAENLSLAEATTSALAASNTDAVLVALQSFSGYTAPGVSMDYEPDIAIDTKLVSKDGRVLFEDRITYGFMRVASTAIHLNSNETYRFKNMEALLANPDKTRAGLIDGARKAAERIAGEIKR
jgi:hypothetical protein